MIAAACYLGYGLIASPMVELGAWLGAHGVRCVEFGSVAPMPKRAVYIGHSLGALPAGMIAAAHPAWTVIAIDPPGPNQVGPRLWTVRPGAGETHMSVVNAPEVRSRILRIIRSQ